MKIHSLFQWQRDQPSQLYPRTSQFWDSQTHVHGRPPFDHDLLWESMATWAATSQMSQYLCLPTGYHKQPSTYCVHFGSFIFNWHCFLIAIDRSLPSRPFHQASPKPPGTWDVGPSSSGSSTWGSTCKPHRDHWQTTVSGRMAVSKTTKISMFYEFLRSRRKQGQILVSLWNAWQFLVYGHSTPTLRSSLCGWPDMWNFEHKDMFKVIPKWKSRKSGNNVSGSKQKSRLGFRCPCWHHKPNVSLDS